MITRERAVAPFEALLVRRGREGLLADVPEVAVCGFEEHTLGWLVSWQSVEYLRSGDFGRMLVGQGPYLVDGEDGSIHHIPVAICGSDRWVEVYLRQYKGVRPADLLLAEVRVLVQGGDRMAALRYVRRQAPRVGLRDANAYVDAVSEGDEPSECLTSLAREEPEPLPLAIEKLAGPWNEGAGG
ncbi:YrhB family protein [Micromonospora sp. R77]|uniref:YrhB domain-containing protein n=1 Tax=Micromonospora sp. R77 TaxID=2925836 RepID=UPI001F604B3A|nr:YrhB domain-containing protein [Micromonospora sp. R77]MCI4066074.1 YrhB family protein [Micromonospora sp. R77]